MKFLTTCFYYLFKWFPILNNASQDASNRIYDEYLDAVGHAITIPAPGITIQHDDSYEPPTI